MPRTTLADVASDYVRKHQHERQCRQLDSDSHAHSNPKPVGETRRTGTLDYFRRAGGRNQKHRKHATWTRTVRPDERIERRRLLRAEKMKGKNVAHH